jgi:hypothetical protein
MSRKLGGLSLPQVGQAGTGGVYEGGSVGSFDQISVSARTSRLKCTERNVPSYANPLFMATCFDQSVAGLM